MNFYVYKDLVGTFNPADAVGNEILKNLIYEYKTYAFIRLL